MHSRPPVYVSAVRGWPELATEAEQLDWVDHFSDHGLLFFEVQEIYRAIVSGRTIAG